MSTLLNELEHVYFCTGARNEKLLPHFDQEKITFEVDERAASFKALGRAKISRRPVGICTTSGTAVAECIPALLEAYYSNIPLILISGDRPKKLHHTGAPQTVQHELITYFMNHNYFECDFNELPTFSLEGFNCPIHINILIDDTCSHDLSIKYQNNFDSFERFLENIKSPFFLFSLEEDSMKEFILKFKDLNLPFYAETLSGGHEYSTHDLESLHAFDSIIRVGHTPLSKAWRLLEKNPKEVFSFDNRRLPALSFGEVLSMSSTELVAHEKFWELLRNHSFDYSELSLKDSTLEKKLFDFPQSEPALFRHLQESIPEGSLVYLGNSLVIRFFEMTQKKSFRVFGNRGVNGIDGQLATAIGIALGTEETVFCILGDLTTRYDLSSLADLPKNLKLIIINNKGGRIFEMLKLNPKIILSHDENFSKIASAFNLSYSNNLHDLETHQVLELFPSQEETLKFLEEMNR